MSSRSKLPGLLCLAALLLAAVGGCVVWMPMGTALDGYGVAVRSCNGQRIVGGSFGAAGGVAAFNAAAWSD